MDALSDVLRSIRLAGGAFLRAEFTAPWCVSSKIEAQDLAPFVAEPTRIMLYHFIVEGDLAVQVPGAREFTATAGQVIILPRNDEHSLGSKLDRTPVPAAALRGPPGRDGWIEVRHGGGGATTRMICGFLGYDGIDTNPLIASLPPVLTLDLRQGAAAWIASSFNFAAEQTAAGSAGSTTVIARLSELLFVEAVRGYLDTLPAEDVGWLAGLRDPYVGKCLGLLHGHVAHPWTLDSLGREVGLSRSALAERFARLLGEPPMHYLARWRLQSAARTLQATPSPVARVAAAVGYESEPAFNRAFKRAFGHPPAAWRARQLAAVPEAGRA